MSAIVGPEKTSEDVAMPGRTVVRPHPTGGFTHARLVGGTCRIYEGWWRSELAALLALVGGAR
jgi:hypothetical protein